MKESIFLSVDLVMLLQKGSPLLDGVNDIIRVLESGIYNQWVQNCIKMREITRSEASATKTLEREF